MSEQDRTAANFHHAVQELIQRIIRECQYTPEEYLRRTGEHDGLEVVKLLLAGPLSDDSISLWARGRSDLTVEALALNNGWRTLFSDEEQSTAERRCADMSFAVTALPPEIANALSEMASRYLPEDDILWGEELSDGIAVCEKLAQVEDALRAGDEDIGPAAWTLAYFRKHLAACPACDTRSSSLKQALAEFDGHELRSISELLTRCAVCLNCSEERATRLLSKEWKDAGFALLPSEAEAAGITLDGWKNPSMPEHTQINNWLRLLSFRAAQLCARTGAVMLRYEETHVSRFWVEEDSEKFPENPWRVWRFADQTSGPSRFVRGLSEDEFVIALLARNIAQMGGDPPRRVLTLPTDGDISELDKILAVEVKTDSGDWAYTLSENFATDGVTMRIGSSDEGADATNKVSPIIPHQEHSQPNWAHVLYLASCAARNEGNIYRCVSGKIRSQRQANYLFCLLGFELANSQEA